MKVITADEKKTKKYQFFFILAIAFSFIITCSIVLFRVSRNSKINEQRTESVFMAREVEHYLLINKENLNLAAINIEHMLSRNESHQSIYEYMKSQSKVNYEVIKENYTGVYGLIDGEYLDGMDFVPDSNYNPKLRPWYKDAIQSQGKIAFVSPYIDAETQEPIFSMSKMLKDGESVLSLDVTLSFLQNLCSEVADSGKGHLLITDKSGLIIVSEDPSIVGIKLFEVADKNDKKLGDVIFSKNKKNDVSIITYQGRKFMLFDQVIEGQWHAVTFIDQKTVYGNLWYIYPLCAIIVLISFLIIFLIYSKINKEKNKVYENYQKLTSLANVFLCMYELDLENDTFAPVKTMPYYEAIVKEYGNKLSEVLPPIMKVLSSDESWESVRTFVDMKTVKERLVESDSINLEFRGVRHFARARFVVVSRSENKIPVKAMYVIEDISDEIKKRNELQKAANTDKMTGTLNRRAWESTMADIREQKNLSSISIFIFDINGLKVVNDTLGHQKGDELIIQAADILKNEFSRFGDIYRLGGDEFGIISEKDIGSAEKLKNEFEDLQTEFNKNNENSVTIAMGIAQGAVDKYDSIEDLTKLADERMYENKEKYHKKELNS